MIVAGILPIAYSFEMGFIPALPYQICGGMIISGGIQLGFNPNW